MDIRIIFEDEDLVVLEKPAGITVNRSDTTKGERTVQDWLEERIARGPVPGFPSTPVKQASSSLRSSAPPVQALPATFDVVGNPSTRATPRSVSPLASPASGSLRQNEDFINRSGIVHRLDKETSGILLVAKNQETFKNLQKQFKERRVKKMYIALAHGKVVPDDGEIRVPVGRLPWNRKRFGIVAGGREAVTKYKILNMKYKKEEPLTLLELYPETGRTHQIRVHLKHVNHPVFSDSLYAGRKTARDDRKFLSRMFLHASKISFTHPKTNQPISFESRLPENLTKFLATLSS